MRVGVISLIAWRAPRVDRHDPPIVATWGVSTSKPYAERMSRRAKAPIPTTVKASAGTASAT
jgi:hypothetical protein